MPTRLPGATTACRKCARDSERRSSACERHLRRLRLDRNPLGGATRAAATEPRHRRRLLRPASPRRSQGRSMPAVDSVLYTITGYQSSREPPPTRSAMCSSIALRAARPSRARSAATISSCWPAKCAGTRSRTRESRARASGAPSSCGQSRRAPSGPRRRCTSAATIRLDDQGQVVPARRPAGPRETRRRGPPGLRARTAVMLSAARSARKPSSGPRS